MSRHRLRAKLSAPSDTSGQKCRTGSDAINQQQDPSYQHQLPNQPYNGLNYIYSTFFAILICCTFVKVCVRAVQLTLPSFSLFVLFVCWKEYESNFFLFSLLRFSGSSLNIPIRIIILFHQLSTLNSTVCQAQQNEISSLVQSSSSPALAAVNNANNGLLVCPEGWSHHGIFCYKYFKIRHSWPRAADVCRRYGSELSIVSDFHQNNITTFLVNDQLKDGPLKRYWIGTLN